MLDYLIKIKKFVPKDCVETVFNIDYNKLYLEGKKFILFDLDNTLIPYDKSMCEIELKNLFLEIEKIGFTIVIISNNKEERVKTFCFPLGFKYISFAKKPLKKGFKKAMKLYDNMTVSNTISIGDQLMTDVYGSSRMNLECILVRPLKKSSEKWYTKFNRHMEKSVLKRLKKHYNDIYLKIEEKHEY